MISEDKINSIKHCPKSLRYHNEELSIKKDVNSKFDNFMGSFDGAKLSDL